MNYKKQIISNFQDLARYVLLCTNSPGMLNHEWFHSNSYTNVQTIDETEHYCMNH